MHLPKLKFVLPKLKPKTTPVNVNSFDPQNRLLIALRSLDIAAMSTIETERFCQNIVDLIQQELGYLIAVIALTDYDHQTIKRVAISKTFDLKLQELLKKLPVPFHQQNIPFSVKDNLLVRSVTERAKYYTENVYDIQKGIFSPEISRQIQDYCGFKGIFIYPLVSKEKVVGVIYFLSSKTKLEVPRLEFMIMEEFASEVSRALDNILLYQSLKTDKEVISAERNKLEVILSGINDAVVAVDLKRNIISFNRAAAALTGYTSPDVLGKPVDQIIQLFDNGNKLDKETYCPIRVDGFEGIVFTKNNLKLSGFNHKEAQINLISSQITEGVNVNLGCILTLHDRTQEQQLEEMKLDFVAMAAHELRTPLTSIRNYLSVFINENKEKLNPEQNMFLGRIETSTKQLMAVVEDLLNISRIERGTIILSQKPTNWPEFVKQFVYNFTSQAKERDITLKFIDPQQVFPPVLADPLRISEVLSNLLTNAITYTYKGGGVNVFLEVKDNWVITHVADNGPGIPPEALPHLFTKFFRISRKLEMNSKGTGLGLYISKSIMDMHKGKIWVRSEPGRGSIFSFSLPLANN